MTYWFNVEKISEYLFRYRIRHEFRSEEICKDVERVWFCIVIFNAWTLFSFRNPHDSSEHLSKLGNISKQM